jgi:hypothetical protein
MTQLTGLNSPPAGLIQENRTLTIPPRLSCHLSDAQGLYTAEMGLALDTCTDHISNTERWERTSAELSAAIALYRATEMALWLPEDEAGDTASGSTGHADTASITSPVSYHGCAPVHPNFGNASRYKASG